MPVDVRGAMLNRFLAALLVVLPALSHAGESADEKYLQYMRWLCVRAKENAPDNNPVRID